MQEEMEHQQQTSLDGFGDNTFVDSPQDATDSDFIISNKNINIIRTGFTKSSHLDINETNSQFCQNSPGNMENNVAAESNPLSDQVNAYDKSKSSIGVNLRVTGQCCQGGRKYMEDFFSVAYQQTDNMRDLEYAFIGIYDGHGGSEAATFAKEHLMMEIINQKQFWSDSDQDVLRAIREGYIATHYAMWREQENWPKTTNGLLSTAGTTATVAFIRNEKIYIGHVGDSGVVLGYQNEGENFWRAKQLTTDHKPESPAERSRIMHAGGKVGVKSGVPRVVWTRPRNHGHRGPVRANTPVEEIPFLAVARSLGDLWSYNAEFNEFVVSPDPDVQVIDINPNTFRCLIFGTDGLWNVVTAQEAVDTVFSREKMNESIAQNKQTNEGKNVPWINPSKGLVELALRTWSEKKMRADNTSVVTVILYPPATNINKSAAESAQIDSKKEQRKSVNDANFATFLDDRTNFQEISEKYLRPERFRNINNPHYENEYLGWNTADAEGMRSNNWLWRCDTDTETEDNEASEVNESTQVRMEQSLQSFDELAKPRTVYTNTTRIVDIESVQKINSVDHSDLYVNSFAETYNSLLDAQISRSSKEQPVPVSDQPATTSTPLSSSSGLHMQQILQEQQMYQQQCMSGEDGYMLTTLETRREQQRFAGMPTFKVFEAVQSESDNFNADSLSFMVNTEENSDSDSLRAELASVLEQNVSVAAQKVEETSAPSAAAAAEKITEESVKLEEKEIKQEPVEDAELITIKQEIKEEPEEEELEKKEQEKCDVEKPQKPSPKKFKTQNKASCVETTPSLVEDEDGVLEGARSSSPRIQQRVRRKCFVQITDVSYVDEVEDVLIKQKEKIATHSDFVEHIDKIEILADKPELVIESGPTSSKPNTRSTTGAASAKTNQDKQYFRDPPPFYKPQRPQPGLRSYNGWMPGSNARRPTENEFSEFIRANMDYAAASAFSSFVDAMKRRFPGFNVDNTLFSKIFDPRHMRYHDFTINAKNNASHGSNATQNRNNRHMPNTAGKGAMPNMTSKGPIPAMFGKGPMGGKSKEGTQPTTNGKAGTAHNKSGKRSMPTGAGEMIVNYFLLKQKQFAAQERKAQNKDETTKKKNQKTDATDDSVDEDDDDDDENPEDLQYYESILATWLPLMDSMEDPEFQRHLLKSKDFMDCFETMPTWCTSTTTNIESSHAATNGTEKTDAKSKPNATRSTTTSTTTATTTTSTAESTEKVEISKASKVSATKEKVSTANTTTTTTLPTKTLATQTKCEKEVQIPIVRTVKVHSKKPAPKSTTITTTTTTAAAAAVATVTSVAKPKSCKNKSSEVSPTAAVTATATADLAVEPKTRASKRATNIESTANTRSAVGSTSSTTATATENIIGTVPVKRIKR